MAETLDQTNVIRAQIYGLASFIATNVASLITTSNIGTLIKEFYMQNPNGTAEELIDFLSSALSGLTGTEELYNLIYAYKLSVEEPDIGLADLNVDFEAIKASISSTLAATAPWKDDVTAAVGQSLVNAFATAITYNVYNIVRCAGEAMLPTATLESSVFAATRHLGVRIARNTPAECQASLTYTGTSFPVTIPAYTQFYCGDIYLFNRDDIVITETDSASSVNLYEGEVSSVDFQGTGLAYQSYTFGNSSNTLSDTDVVVSVDSIDWSKTTTEGFYHTGLWTYSASDKVYVDDTSPDGNIEISFGNGTFGAIPALGSDINITYVITSGSSGNSVITGNTITCNLVDGLSGTALNNLTGGADSLSIMDYKNLSPGRYSAKNGAVTNSQYNALVASYAGVVDGYVIFQQDYAPDDITQSMKARVVLLTSSTWSATQNAQFLTWLKTNGIANMQYTLIPANPVTMNITVTIGCYPQSNLTSIEGLSKSAIINLFQVQEGVLGYSRYLSDIEKCIQEVSSDIDYIVFSSDTQSQIITDKSQYVTLGTLTVNTEYSSRIIGG